MLKPAVALTESEWVIIKAIWETEPCTAPAIQERLFKATGWHYSTVRTLMDRMVAKGMLSAKKEGKLTVYSSTITRTEAQRGELFYALKHAFNGALTPMVQCLLENHEINRDDLEKLEAMIKARKNAGKK